MLERLLRIALITQIVGFVFFIAGTHGLIVPMPAPPTTTDYAGFYAAGMLANEGTPELAYDTAAHTEAEARAIAPGVEDKIFLNPPIFLLLCAPLARLPYLPSFVVFELATSLLWLAVTTRIAGGGRSAALALASVPAVWWALGWGQNSFLSAALMGAGTMLLRKRPFAAGAAFGTLCFKPHFGIVLPLALLAGRQWRAVAGAVASVTALVGLSWLWFGAATWRAFFTMAQHARATVESGRIKFAGHIDLAGAARLLGADARTGWALQLAISVLAAVAVVWLWGWQQRRTAAPEAARAGLVAATMIAMPFLLFYDLVMASVAASWIARAARAGGWLPGERAGLIIIWLAALLAFPSALLLHIALGVIVAPVLLVLTLRRAGQYTV